MLDNMFKIRYLIIFLILVLLAIFFLAYLSFGTKRSTEKSNYSTSELPVPRDFNVDYSKINLLIPGKSTIEDVERINGKPESKVNVENNVYFYYKTPSADYKNVVAIKDGIVQYAKENIFRGLRGTYMDYQTRFGNPSLTLYDINNPLNLEVSVFLKYGVAVGHQDDYVAWILYFTPQEGSAFIKSIAADLKLLRFKPETEDY